MDRLRILKYPAAALIILLLAQCKFLFGLFPSFDIPGDIIVIVTFADLSQEQDFNQGAFAWNVWFDVDGNVGTGWSIGNEFDGADLLYSIATDAAMGLGTTTIHRLLGSLLGEDSFTVYALTGTGIGEITGTAGSVLVDGNRLVFQDYAASNEFAALSPSHRVRVEVNTPLGYDKTNNPLTGDGKVTDPAGDVASNFVDILSVEVKTP